MSDDNKPKSAINWPVIESLKVEPLKIREAIKKIESLPKYKKKGLFNSP